MRTRQSKSVVIPETVKAGMIGAVVAALVMIALTAIAAVGMDRGALAEEYRMVAASVARFIGVFAGVALAGSMVKDKKIQAALVALGGVLFLLIGTTVICWDGNFEHFITSVLGCVAFSALGVGFNMLPRKGRRSSKTHRRYR